MPEKKRPRTRRSPDARRPLPRMMYTWWMHQRRTVARTRKIQLRINLPKYNPSASVSGAALSLAALKTATPAQEKITLQKVPKTTKTPLKQLINKMNGKMGRLALVNKDSEDGSYLLLSKDEVSLGTNDFIVPEESLEQERFKR